MAHLGLGQCCVWQRALTDALKHALLIGNSGCIGLTWCQQSALLLGPNHGICLHFALYMYSICMAPTGHGMMENILSLLESYRFDGLNGTEIATCCRKSIKALVWCGLPSDGNH